MESEIQVHMLKHFVNDDKTDGHVNDDDITDGHVNDDNQTGGHFNGNITDGHIYPKPNVVDWH